MSVSNTTKRVKEIRRKTRRKFSSEEKTRIVLEGLPGECSIAERCGREGIHNKMDYCWSKNLHMDQSNRLDPEQTNEILFRHYGTSGGFNLYQTSARYPCESAENDCLIIEGSSPMHLHSKIVARPVTTAGMNSAPEFAPQ